MKSPRFARWVNAKSRIVDIVVAAVVVLGILGLFLFDISHPRGEVDGVGYAALVALNVRFGKRAITASALLTTALTVVGTFLVPDYGISVAGEWANRGFAIAEIWIITVLMLNRLSLEIYIQGREERLKSNQAALARMVRDALLSSATFEQRLHSITEICADQMGAEYVAILQGRPRSDAMRLLDTYQRSTGRHLSLPDQPRNALPMYRERMRNELVVAADDVHGSSLHIERLDLFKELGIGAILAADMFNDQPGQGAIAFAHKEPHHWTEQEIAFARGVAGVVALLISANRNVETFAAIDLVGEGIYAEDEQGAIQYANRAAKQLAQDNPESGEARYPRPDATLVSDRDLHEITFGDRQLELERARLPNGGVITRINDVTARNQAVYERSRLESRVRQGEKMEAIGQLAGGVAHDFNNIMGAIRGFAGFLIQDLPPKSTEHGFAERIVSACERGKSLVDQILAFASSRTIEQGVVDLGTLMRREDEILAELIPPSATLSVQVDEEPMLVLASKVQIEQLIANLCINARDALEGGSGKIAVSVRRATTDEVNDIQGRADRSDERSFGEIRPGTTYALLRVADNGVGIPAAVLDRVFEPFFTTKGRQRGTGLGLAVVHGVVNSTGGYCNLRSSPGEGTTFSIYLPLVAGTASAAAPAPIERTDPYGRERILVVDDECDVADMISIGLERLGYETVTANEPHEALAAITEDATAFDVVITDQVMPGIRGIELIRRIKEINPKIKAVLCTGYSDGANEQVARAAGADAFFSKPVDALELAPVLRKLLREAAVQSAAPPAPG